MASEKHVNSTDGKGGEDLPVDVSNQKLTKLPNWVYNSHALSMLNAKNNKLARLGKKLFKLTRLAHLNMRNNNLKKLTRGSRLGIDKLTSLRYLDLGQNQLSRLPVSIAQLARLDSLSLDHNHLTQLPREIVTGLSKLQILHLDYNNIGPTLFSVTKSRDSFEDDDSSEDVEEEPVPNQTIMAASGEVFDISTCWNSTLKHLSISWNRLAVCPDGLARLASLTYLDLSHNQLRELPDDIGNLSLLHTLIASSNPVESLPSTLYKLHNSLHTLHIDYNRLQFIPPQIYQLTKLVELKLNNNLIGEIGHNISQLTSLKVLHLNDNRVRYIPFEITTLPVVQSAVVDVSTGIPLTDINQHDIHSILSMSEDTLSHSNEATFAVHLEGNPLEDQIPREVIKLGNAAVISFVRSINQSKAKWRRVKLMFVGEENVGKSTLLRILTSKFSSDSAASNNAQGSGSEPSISTTASILNLLGSSSAPNIPVSLSAEVPIPRDLNKKATMRDLGNSADKNKATDGIKIYDWVPEMDEEITSTLSQEQLDDLSKYPLVYSCWDFAGQDVYYPTHQFFLSGRCITLLMFNLTDVKGSRIEYWLKAIKQRAGVGVGAPACLLVGTHRDDKRVADERVWTDTLAKLKHKYQSKFSFIKGYFAISCKSLKGIRELKKKILDLTLSSRVMSQQDVPLGWVMLVDHIKRKRQQEQIINVAQFAQFARSCAGVEVPDIPTLIRFYNSVGILSFFDDTSDDAQFLKFIHVNKQPSKSTMLNELVILNPQWIADLMSTIITIKHSFAKDGVLLESDLPQIWREYPTAMYDALLNLLEKFEVAYRLRNSNMIVSPAITFLAKLPMRYERIKRKNRPGRSNTVFALNYQEPETPDSAPEETVGRERSGTVIVHDILPPFVANAVDSLPINDITNPVLKSPRLESPLQRETKDDAGLKKVTKGSAAVTRTDRSKSFDLGKKNAITSINLSNLPKPFEKSETSPKDKKEKEKEKDKRKSPRRKRRDSDMAPRRPSLAKSDNVVQSLSAEKLSSIPSGQPVGIPSGGSLDSVMDQPLPLQVINLKSSAEALDDSIESSVESDVSSEEDPISPTKKKKDRSKREKKKEKPKKAKLIRNSSGKIKLSSTVTYSPETKEETKAMAIKGVMKRTSSRSNNDTPVGSPATGSSANTVSFDVRSSPESSSASNSERASSPRAERGRDSAGIKIIVPCLLPKEPNLKMFDALWPEPFAEFTSDPDSINYDEMSGNLIVSIDGNDQGNCQEFLHPVGRVLLFDFMPLGFMARLIVRTLQLRQVKPLYFWRHGIMLDLINEDTSFTSRGLIVFDELNYNLHIRIRTKKNKEGVDERAHIKHAAQLMMLLMDNINILLSHSWFKFSKQPEIRIPCSHCLESKFDKIWTDPNAVPSVMNICWFTLEECLMRIYTGSDHVVCSVTRQSERVANLFSNNTRMRKLYNNYALNSGLRLVHDARRRFEPTLKTNVPLADICPDLTFSFLNASSENNISSLLVNFEDFVLERKLAVGGFAEIFVGKQKRKESEYANDDKVFAIKVLLNQMKQVTLPPSPRNNQPTPEPEQSSNTNTPPTVQPVAADVEPTVVSNPEPSGTVSPPPEEVVVSNQQVNQQQLLQLQNLERAKQSFAPQEVTGTEADELMDREAFSLLGETFRELQHEVFVMCQLRHPNIVTLHALSINPIALFMEFYPLGSLDKYLRASIEGRSASNSPRGIEQPKALSWKYRVKVALDIAQGMSYLHGEDIIHRDLRSPNVLITDLLDDAEVVAKVTDFGMAQYLAGSLYGGDFNECWTAPEVQEGQEYNNKCDVYSFGIIMWELLQIGYPFMEFNDKYGSVPRSEFARAVTNGLRPSIPNTVPDEYASVVALCWQSSPDLRPSFNEVVEMLVPLLKVCNKWPAM